MRLDITAFSPTCAAIWAAGLFLLTWWVIAFDGQSSDPTWIGHIYRGYRLTLAGSLIGALWAFFDGLIGRAIFAWRYDRADEPMTTVRRRAA